MLLAIQGMAILSFTLRAPALVQQLLIRRPRGLHFESHHFCTSVSLQ
jgi:hypothetical protein